MKKITFFSIVVFFCFAISNVFAQKNSTINGSGSVNRVAKFTGTTTIGNSSIYDNGKIGIGTTNPQYKLQVETGSFTNDWTAFFNNQSAYGKGLLIEAVLPNAAPNNPILQLQTVENTVRFKVQANGKIGVNTSNPQATLDVNGSARISNLGGSGTKMVITDNDGDLSRQTIPVNTDNQTLSISGNTLSISNGNSVSLPSGADNLGNHTATQNIKLNGHWLSGDGGNEGVFVDNFGDTYIDGAVGIRTAPGFYSLTVSGSCIADEWLTYSKSNINMKNIISNPLMKIISLKGITYKDKNNKTKVAFNPEQVKKYFPSLVRGSHDGVYGINYSGFIPYLTEAIKKQQSQIEELRNRVKELNTLVETLLSNNNYKNEVKPDYLEQNVPNPANNKTTIHFKISSKFNNAYIRLIDLSGNEINKYYINDSGSGKVEVDLNSIPSGVYTYSLVVNNNIVDTKKMIVN